MRGDTTQCTEIRSRYVVSPRVVPPRASSPLACVVSPWYFRCRMSQTAHRYPRASSPPVRRPPPCVCRLPVVFQVQDVSNSSQVSPCVIPPPVRRPPLACVVSPWYFRCRMSQTAHRYPRASSPPRACPPRACVVPPWLFSLNVLLKPFSIAKDTGLMTGMPLSTYPYG